MTGEISWQIIVTALEQTAKKLAIWSENKSSTCSHTNDVGLYTPADEMTKNQRGLITATLQSKYPPKTDAQSVGYANTYTVVTSNKFFSVIEVFSVKVP